MCQFTSACPTRHHTYGKCRYSGRRPASGGVGSVVGLGVLVVAVASYLGFTPARLVEVVTSRPTQSASATPRTTGNAAQTPNLRRVGECDVQEVVDGDTLVCSTGQRVRLLGVDAPELARNGRPQQCHAKSARRALTSLVGGRTVTLHADDGQPARDVYGRTLAYARLSGAERQCAAGPRGECSSPHLPAGVSSGFTVRSSRAGGSQPSQWLVGLLLAGSSLSGAQVQEAARLLHGARHCAPSRELAGANHLDESRRLERLHLFPNGRVPSRVTQLRYGQRLIRVQ